MNLSSIELVVKVSALMAVAGITTALMRRRASAASRHLVWTLAIVGALALPIASLAMPSVTIPTDFVGRPFQGRQASIPSSTVVLETDASVAAGRAGTDQNVSSAASSSWIPWLPMFYGAGVILLLGRLVLAQWKIRRLLARTTTLTDPQWTGLLRDCTARLGVTRAVRLVLSREQAMPMSCGILRPVVVIPSIAGMWDDDRRRAVLLHELAHVVRFDCLTQMLAEVAAAFYWPHPGAWWMAHRLRVERELACDDCVIASGTEPREYAGHLLEIAHSLGGYQAPALVVSMARPRQLEGRMLAMLDATRNRATPAASRRLIALALTAVIVAPLAGATTAATPGTTPGTTAVQAAAGQAAKASPAAQDHASAPPLAPGTWQLRVSTDGRSANVTVSAGEHSFHSMTIPVDRLEGLAAILSGPGGPVHYSLKREAGTFDFEGTLRSGVGGGTFTFAPNAAFSAELVRRGFAKPTPAEQETLAGADIGFVFIDELTAQKYARPTLQQLVNGAQHGVSRNYVREMADLGYRLGTVDALIRQRDHGVNPQFIRDLQAQGLAGLTADDLVRARDHGVDPGFVRDLRALGHTSLDLPQLVNARDHGVSPDYVQALRQRGYQLTLPELIAARDHGVDAGYANDIAAAGYPHPTMAQLIQLRNHGITPKYVQDVHNRRGDLPSIERLISLHDRGLTADAAQAQGPQLHAASFGDTVNRLFYRIHRLLAQAEREASQ